MLVYALVGIVELLQDLYLTQNRIHTIELYTASRHVFVPGSRSLLLLPDTQIFHVPRHQTHYILPASVILRLVVTTTAADKLPYHLPQHYRIV